MWATFVIKSRTRNYTCFWVIRPRLLLEWIRSKSHCWEDMFFLNTRVGPQKEINLYGDELCWILGTLGSNQHRTCGLWPTSIKWLRIPAEVSKTKTDKKFFNALRMQAKGKCARLSNELEGWSSLSYGGEVGFEVNWGWTLERLEGENLSKRKKRMERKRGREVLLSLLLCSLMKTEAMRMCPSRSTWVQVIKTQEETLKVLISPNGFGFLL